ncbi:MAG: hypothetical protein ACRCXC_11715 [Legionella sp.]
MSNTEYISFQANQKIYPDKAHHFGLYKTPNKRCYQEDTAAIHWLFKEKMALTRSQDAAQRNHGLQI